jgi:hypothetical protein
MRSQRFFQLFTVFGALLSIAGILLFFKQGDLPLLSKSSLSSLVAQNTNTYLGPNQKVPGNPQLIRVQVLAYNDPNPKGVEIREVIFDGTCIPLKPRDIYGFRGQASFQKPPGKYKLSWIVEKDKQAWPRTISHEEEVILDPRDLWIQITITGNAAEIS